MSQVTRMGVGSCPECGEDTIWMNGEHICSEHGVIEGEIQAGATYERVGLTSYFWQSGDFEGIDDRGIGYLVQPWDGGVAHAMAFVADRTVIDRNGEIVEKSMFD